MNGYIFLTISVLFLLIRYLQINEYLSNKELFTSGIKDVEKIYL